MTNYSISNTSFKFDFHNEAFMISFGILGPLVLILNLLILISVILILIKGPNKPKSYIVLGNICFANLISVISEIIITYKTVETYSPSSAVEYQPDRVEMAFLVSSNLASMWSICFLALDRLIYIVYAMEYDTMMSLKVNLCATIITWCIGSFFGLMPKQFLDKTVLLQDYKFKVSLLLLVQMVTSTFIAFVILITYLLLYIIYRRKMLKQRVLITMKYTFKTTVIAMISCASFVISWEPFLISMIIYYMYCSDCNFKNTEMCKQISATIVSPLPITSLLNAFFNPTAYIWWHRPFIQDMKHVYCSKRLREQKRAEFINEIQSAGPYLATHL